QLRPSVPHLQETRTTTLTKTDFFHREDTCTSSPYHLLYTGRMARQKGLLEMVEALAILVAQGRDVILDLVGWPEKNDDILAELQTLAQVKGIPERVRYHGFKPVGPELFSYYQQADIYVLASQSSFEGFPRTIWEAMAHNLPVVATKVGSIPEFIQGAAQLIEPRNVSQLADAIQLIIENAQLRRTLIAKGSALAGKNTLEFQVAKMISSVNRWLRDHNHEQMGSSL
ncbi:MAG: glycosyltransferase family 4 protein, partial [Firmicutes bacterium]|nr:glycosyltransferase family 4 protein [Bacillota bacterium]